MSDSKRTGRSEKWRKAHSVAMRLHQNRLQRGRAIAANKTPTTSKLKQRAGRMAMAKLRMKFAGAKGMKYSELSGSAKIQVDNLVAKNIDSKVVRQLTKSLLPKVRQAAAKRHKELTHPVHPDNSGEKKKLTEAFLRTRMGRKPQAVRNRAKVNKFSVKRMTNTKIGGSDQAFSRSASYSLGSANQDIYKTTNDGVDMFKTTRRQQVKKMRGRMRSTASRARDKSSHHRVKHTTRARSGNNRGLRASIKQAGLLRNDFSDINTAMDVLTEDVVQDKIESLFLRGLVPKHQIQRYRRVLNDPKRYIKFRQYHDEILTLFRTFMEYLTDDSTIFQKVRQQVMAKNHGRMS